MCRICSLQDPGTQVVPLLHQLFSTAEMLNHNIKGVGDHLGQEIGGLPQIFQEHGNVNENKPITIGF